MKRAAQWAPYAITAVVIAAILHKYPPDEIAAHVALGNPWPLLPIALGGVLVTLLMIATADAMVVQGCCDGRRATWTDVVRAKAGSSLLDVFGYTVGHGAYAVWIGRFSGVRAALAAGAMLYIMASDLISVSLTATFSMAFAGSEIPPGLRVAAPLVAGVLVLFIVIGPYRLLTGRRSTGGEVPPPDPPLLFEPWATIPRRTGLFQAGVRALHIVFWSFATWAAATLFGLDVPLTVMLAYMPVILLIGALPINVAGFGAVQGVWLLLLGDYAPGAQILAFVFVWTLAVQVSIVLRGLPFVNRVVAEVHASN